MRTIDAIYNEMLANKADKSSLNGLTSVSDTAIWRLIFYICAVAIFVHEQMFDQHVIIVNDNIELRRIGSVKWYHQQAKNYQHGDDLILNNDYLYDYALIDTSKQIIDRVAVIEQVNTLLIKVTKENNVPLDNTELTGFTQYMNKIKVAGTNLIIYNYNPDTLQIDIDVYYNPLLLNSSGELISDTDIKPVELAINDYIKNIVFGGQFNIQKCVDAIQSASGVEDLLVNTIKAKSDTELTYSTVNLEYVSKAGHFSIDTLTINYYPKNV